MATSRFIPSWLAVFCLLAGPAMVSGAGKSVDEPIKHVKVTVAFLGSQWATMKARQDDVQKFTQGIVDSPFMDILTKPYGVGRGKTDSHILFADDLGKAISDDDIRRKYLTSKKLPVADASRLHIFFVQRDVVVTAVFDGKKYSTSATAPAGTLPMLGYHDHAGNAHDGVDYAVIAYPGGKNLGPASPESAVKDAISEIASHEIAEATVRKEVADAFNGVYVRMKNGIAVQTIAGPAGEPLNPEGAVPLSKSARKKGEAPNRLDLPKVVLPPRGK